MENKYTAKKLSVELGISASMLSAWRQGSFPAGEQMPKLKQLANAQGRSLSEILVGESDVGVSSSFDREEILNSLCEIRIIRLIPKNRLIK